MVTELRDDHTELEKKGSVGLISYLGHYEVKAQITRNSTGKRNTSPSEDFPHQRLGYQEFSAEHCSWRLFSIPTEYHMERFTSHYDLQNWYFGGLGASTCGVTSMLGREGSGQQGIVRREAQMCPRVSLQKDREPGQHLGHKGQGAGRGSKILQVWRA